MILTPDSNYTFPIKIFGKKGRKFNLSWLQRWNWLAYSDLENGVFCKYCVSFYKKEGAGKGMHSPPKSFVHQPFVNWKDAIEYFKIHESNEYHKFSMVKVAEFLKIVDKKQNDVYIQLHKRNESEIKRNRDILKVIIKILILCGRQGLALRGGRDSGSLDLNLPLHNDGNFRALLRYRIDSGDDLFLNHIKNCGKNSTYISADIQNELISIICDQIHTTICNRIKKNKFFVILADETTDVGRVEQFSLCIRTTTGLELAKTIISTLTALGLNLQQMRGQGYDGAANMGGVFRGVQALILKEYPKALYTHCFSHCLNLCLNDASKVQQIRNTLNIIQEVKNKPFSGLKKYCETRWVERHEAHSIFVDGFLEIVLALEDLMTSENDKNAILLHKSLCNFQFLITCSIMERVLGITYTISKYLQTENIDIITATNLIETTITKIENLRNEEEFQTIFDSTIEIAEKVGVTPIIPRTVGTQKHRVNYTVNNGDCCTYYRVSSFCPYLDDLLSSFNERFNSNSNLISSLSYSYNSTLKGEFELWQMKWETETVIPTNSLDTLLNFPEEIFPNIYTMLKIFSILPVTTASVERSFSTLKRIKTYLRNSTSENRLNGLALLNIHRDIDLDINLLIDVFANKKERRLDFKL
ncbi:zinc finger MYM-type protein 1-like [Aphis craccivora]|uniref:Zinc finger MYM-type protein 1-like n=1 Tax=Aphis craccivora TaxID=307492 RepID=A0A6G0VTP0_APHCR|nr:zinc finger MYM-type protein 1-like [Aphis craccivora]